MSDGATIILLVVLILIWLSLHNVRKELTRIADFCERSEARMRQERRP